MDVKLENLIEKIKSEAVDEAHKAADAIIQEAKDKATSIIEQAKKDAGKMLEESEKKVGQFQRNSELALQQAARDSQLLLKERLIQVFDDVFRREVAETLSPEFLSQLISTIVKSWAENPEADLQISEKDLKGLEGLLFKSLNQDVKKSITLKPSAEISAGFRIGMKDGNVYYDFTDESIADLLKMFLNPKLNEILDVKHG